MIKKLLTFLFLVIQINFLCKSDNLKNIFENPYQEARTKVWWFHGETETTKEGIDADLKAFKDAGIGGVVFYDQTHGSGEGAFPSMSKDWWEMIKYAATKAKEMGLTFEMACTNGYVAGGPWITPEFGMKYIVVLRPEDEVPDNFIELVSINNPLEVTNHEYIDTLVQKERITLTNNEPRMVSFDLENPREIRTISYTVRPRGKGAYCSMNIPGKPSEEFFGALYVKIPPFGELEYSDDGKVWHKLIELPGVDDIIGFKSKQRTLNFPPVKSRFFRLNIHDWSGPDTTRYQNFDIENVRLMSYDLLNNWEEKSGLRSELSKKDPVPGPDILPFFGKLKIGYAPSGAFTKHGRSKIVYNGDTLVSKYWPEADILDGKAVTIHYNNYFKVVYDTLTSIGCRPDGMQIDSYEAGTANWTAELPSHFKRLRGYDIEPWIPALGGVIVENREATENFLRDFKRTLAEVTAEQFYGTFADLCHRDGVTLTSQAMLGCVNDNIYSRSKADKPQGEFWAYQTNGNYDCLDAASSAHLFGKKIASGEAFTDTPYFIETDDSDWKVEGWHKLLRIANLAYCKGINEFVVCASTYQPWLDRKYDDSQTIHPYIFHRLNPAWDKSKENFWEYQARCTALLQQGKPVVDILVYVGEDFPAKTLAYKLPEIPEGFNFDVCTLPSLVAWTENKTEFSPDYKVLAVQDRSSISEEAEDLFKILESQGVVIVRCDKGENLNEVLKEKGIKPDIFVKSDDTPDSKVYFTHRCTNEGDIYFVYNHSEKEYTTPFELRDKKSTLEAWDPLTGKPVESSNHSLKPYHSLFLISR